MALPSWLIASLHDKCVPLILFVVFAKATSTFSYLLTDSISSFGVTAAADLMICSDTLNIRYLLEMTEKIQHTSIE
jgi:hypothetical protein